MNTKQKACHVAKIIRKHNGKTYTSYLLRRSVRKDGKVLHENLGNLSHLPAHVIDIIDRSLKGEHFVSAKEAFRILETKPHGHVEVVLKAIRMLGLDSVIASRPSRQRDLVLAMIVQHVLFPCSKLATTRHWHSTTLAEELGLADANKDEVYAAMDWLESRQKAIEKKLAKRHLSEGCLALYDVTSSYYEGNTCPLARRGHNRDKKQGKKIIVYGILADSDGRPIGIDVYPGNTSDPVTVADQVEKLRNRFGLTRVVLAGDRGMLTEVQIDMLRKYPGLGWISALRSNSIRQLIDDGFVQRSLFDHENLAEIHSPEFPGERLVACYNPLLADERRHKRQKLLAATERKLEPLVRDVARRTKKPLETKEIALRAGKVIGLYKMAKHFRLDIADNHFSWSRNEKSIKREEELDGIYVIRTSEPKQKLSAEDTVRSYKRLALLEQGFRSMKLHLKARPIRHRIPPRVKAHLSICMLAQYVSWHLREAWRPLLFSDEELPEALKHRDPVAPATESASVKQKKRTKLTSEGFPAHSIQTLMAHLAKRGRSHCEVTESPGSTFDQVSELDTLQAKAFHLLEAYL